MASQVILHDTARQFNTPSAQFSRAGLSTATVTEIIATAAYLVLVGASEMEIDMHRGQYAPYSQNVFNVALEGAKQGKEWAR